MTIETCSLLSEPDCSGFLEELKERTVMLIGAVGTGKTWLAERLVEKLTEAGILTSLVAADMGQPSVGVPSCLGLSTSPPWDQPAACWFVGDITPVGNLLPTVVGTA